MRRVHVALRQAKRAVTGRLRIWRLAGEGRRASDELVAAKMQEAGAVADLDRLAKRCERAAEAVADWKRGAKVVRYAADIERSKAVQAQLREHELVASEAESELARQRTVVAEAREVLRCASSRLEAVLGERAAFVRQEAFADARSSLKAAEKNLHAALSRATADLTEVSSRTSAETVSKRLIGIVLKLNNDFVEAKKQVAASIADEKRLALQLQQQLAHAAEWAERATKATATNDAELAREALARKDEHGTLARDLREQWSAQKERVDGLKRTLRGMNDLLERAKHTWRV